MRAPPCGSLRVSVTSALMLAMLGMAIFASFATFWPYNLVPSLQGGNAGVRRSSRAG